MRQRDAGVFSAVQKVKISRLENGKESSQCAQLALEN